MTWTGGVTALVFVLFAGMVTVLLIDRWKIYRPSTRAFFCLYVAFLVLRGCTSYSEPVTAMNVVKCLISTSLFIPMLVMIYRVMRMGDPFHISIVIADLKERLRQRDDAELAILGEDASMKERLRREVARLDKVVESLEIRLERLLLKRKTDAGE